MACIPLRQLVCLKNIRIISSRGLFYGTKDLLYETRRPVSCCNNSDTTTVGLSLKSENTSKSRQAGFPDWKPFTRIGMPFNANMFCRLYTTGDLKDLWAAATGGRGLGRGRKKKKGSVQLPEKKSRFGGAKITFAGLNAPILLESEGRRDDRQQRGSREKQRQRKHSIFMSERGWSGATWPGKHAGPPVTPNREELKDFDSIVIEVKRVSTMTPNGRKKTVSSLVVVGNGNGAVGWAQGKGETSISAIRKARNKAANYLYTIPLCDGHTIYHDFQNKHKSLIVKFERKPPGHGLRCQRIIKAVAQLSGIKDMRCKLLGPSTPLTVLRNVFEGLTMQETHQDLAERKGKYVVQFRPEMGMRPTIVASPSTAAINRRLNEDRMNEGIEDVTSAFDPYKGLHQPKPKAELFS